MGTCEQRDTGQGHPDKGTGQPTSDYLQIHGHFCWNGRDTCLLNIDIWPILNLIHFSYAPPSIYGAPYSFRGNKILNIIDIFAME